MSNIGSQIFTVLVKGENPDELMSKYDINKECEKYIKYKYADREKMKNNSTKILKEIISSPNKFSLNSFHVDALKEKLKSIEKMSNLEYYMSVSQGLFYDDNGDAWSTENVDGKWTTAKIGNNFSLPLILKDGSETHQARFKDIDWEKMHLANTEVYEIIWDMVKNGRKPANEREFNLLKNMENKENYFNRFNSCDEYVTHNCAYWNYAFLDENGWKDIDDGGSDVEWVATYFDKFIKPINDNELITVYECSRMKN